MTLETLFGDPYEPTNPLGHEAVLRADERGEMFAGGERLLDDWQANAEFVPRALGGRFDATDALVRRLRPVFRRDGSLGLGYGVTSFMAALNVWLGGSDVQRKWLADTLLAGQKACVAYHELAHGNDLAANELTADRRDGGLVLDGRKEVINNAGRANTAVVFARTDDRPGRSHSLLLVDLDTLAPHRWRRLPRFPTLGLRGCQLAGLAFHDCAVSDDVLVGELGSGIDIALRSFQISRCVMAGNGLGILDAGLFTVLRFALNRKLYGQSVAELPHARSTLAGAFADLLAADALVTVVARALHTLPGNGSVYAAAAKYLVPLLLEDAMNELSVILGARFYLREGEHAIFGKHLRDLPGLSIGHAGGVSCQLTILPQLRSITRGLDGTPPAALFDLDAELPPLDLDKLRLRSRPEDPLLASLRGSILDKQLTELVTEAKELPVSELGVKASPAGFALTERYATLLAAAACLGMRRHDRDTAWIRLALARLTARITPGVPLTALPRTEDEEAVFTELITRAENGVGFCLDEDPVSRAL